MNNFLHFLATYTLLVALVGQVTLLALSLKTGDKPSVVQGAVMAAAEAVISVTVALRPPTPLQFAPDLAAAVAALFLLTPGVIGLAKLRKKQQTGQA